MKQEPIILFTYGTMRYGVYNHARITDLKATYVGHGNTTEPFVMVGRNEPRQIPYVGKVDSDDKRHGNETPIRGDCYLIDKKTLDRVDRAEGHPYFYYREVAHVRLDNGRIVKCVIYLFDSDENWGELIPSGDFIEYYDEKLHEKQGHLKNTFLDPTSKTPKTYRQPTLWETKISKIDKSLNSYIPAKYRAKF